MTDLTLVIRAAAYLLAVPASRLRFQGSPDTDGLDPEPSRRVLAATDEGRSVRLAIKSCSLTERVGLALLNGLGAVPRVFVDDISTDLALDVVMVDAGDTWLGSNPRGQRLAALALSEIHARFLGHDGELGALPSMTEKYLSEHIVARSWRPAWTTSIRDESFRLAFGRWQDPVEESAASLAADLTAFAERLQLNTLVHTDIFPGQIREWDGRALVINWGEARRAPLFVDLGATFTTIEAGWVYRDALADRGVFIDDDLFLRGHRLARRFAGIKYLSYWLNAWLAYPQGPGNRVGLQRMLAMAAGSSSDSA